ncbi:MAG: Flp pilus assembly complex ATPase component TadA [Myxococcales bacterium]|nr:Flp pilus assembly complex ATPase component TadA [Myxococcales bacterium]MCB9735636.1 Flp pilus assembly complex ATPase component TadA [Deltaproteobacteria bacterium]
MLTLSIREKNGEERQLSFDKEEVTIGRASGSDIVLPRNNISKRHARLVDKHDKVVIVDLRSTNGTYVNGRRITAPELLTGEDKVYIGDFVIRLSRPGEAAKQTTPFSERPEVDPRVAHAPTVAAGELGGHDFSGGDDATRAMEAVPAEMLGEAFPEPPGPPPFAPDEDYDDDGEEKTAALNIADLPKFDGPPPMPAAAKATQKQPAPQAPPQRVAPEDVPTAPTPAPPRAAAPPTDAPTIASPKVSAPAQRAQAKKEPAPAPEPEAADGAPSELDAWSEWNATVALVVEAVMTRTKNELTWEQAQQLADSAIDQAVKSGDIAADVEREALVDDVVTELVGLGPLADLLADEEVQRIAANGPDVIRVWRGGTAEPYGRVFASEQSFERILARLAMEAGYAPGEIPAVVETTLPHGAAITIVRPPIASDASIIVVQRPRGAAATAERLVADGVLTRPMLGALEKAVKDGQNVVVAGPPGSGRTTVLAALMSLVGDDERLVIVADGREIVPHHQDVARLNRTQVDVSEYDVYTRVTKLAADRVVIDDVDGTNVSGFVGLALSGGAPILAAARDGEPERLIRRLGLQLALTGVHGDSAAAAVSEAIDVVACLEARRSGEAPVVSKVVQVQSGKDGSTFRVLAKR